MYVQIKPEHEKFVREQVSTGLFADESDVVHEALEAMRMNEEYTTEQISQFRQAVAQGLGDYEAGRIVPFDAEKMISEERRKKGG